MGAVRKDKQEGEGTLKINHISTSTARHFLAELGQLGGKAQWYTKAKEFQLVL